MSNDTSTGGSEQPRMVHLVGEIGSEDDPITVRTEPVPDDGDFTAYGLAMRLKTRGWRNVRGEEPDDRSLHTGNDRTEEGEVGGSE